MNAHQKKPELLHTKKKTCWSTRKASFDLAIKKSYILYVPFTDQGQGRREREREGKKNQKIMQATSFFPHIKSFLLLPIDAFCFLRSDATCCSVPKYKESAMNGNGMDCLLLSFFSLLFFLFLLWWGRKVDPWKGKGGGCDSCLTHKASSVWTKKRRKTG